MQNTSTLGGGSPASVAPNKSFSKKDKDNKILVFTRGKTLNQIDFNEYCMHADDTFVSSTIMAILCSLKASKNSPMFFRVKFFFSVSTNT